eukprot:TRINITY_DN34077_c0_g1_i1.p1 TRINITY_DN34077_c0_g1~~TRINITY_DN34077_c0_g1_i1.p1  ORF type:complete len:189 (+),score=19.82 TRINITY_DN34077_c0_g1_i1:41-607(+)
MRMRSSSAASSSQRAVAGLCFVLVSIVLLIVYFVRSQEAAYQETIMQLTNERIGLKQQADKLALELAQKDTESAEVIKKKTECELSLQDTGRNVEDLNRRLAEKTDQLSAKETEATSLQARVAELEKTVAELNDKVAAAAAAAAAAPVPAVPAVPAAATTGVAAVPADPSPAVVDAGAIQPAGSVPAA